MRDQPGFLLIYNIQNYYFMIKVWMGGGGYKWVGVGVGYIIYKKIVIVDNSKQAY